MSRHEIFNERLIQLLDRIKTLPTSGTVGAVTAMKVVYESTDLLIFTINLMDDHAKITERLMANLNEFETANNELYAHNRELTGMVWGMCRQQTATA